MTEEQRHVDQAGERLIGFRAGEELFRRYSHLLSSSSSSWENLEVANLMLHWLEVLGGLLPPESPKSWDGGEREAESCGQDQFSVCSHYWRSGHRGPTGSIPGSCSCSGGA
ncbi:hypothetical protein AMECASPLE_026343 [Ameca splendens]|uniref:Uncharacterized protein n=1 Tax=Ameca splendens TaxID=208324 RepID=A0ABV0Y5G6_9TELE